MSHNDAQRLQTPFCCGGRLAQWRSIIAAVLAVSCGGAAAADPEPVLLLAPGDPVAGGPPGTVVGSIRHATAAPTGAFAAWITIHSPAGGAKNALWGCREGTAEPQLLVTIEGRENGHVRLRFEDVFGFTSQGQVAYSALIPIGECSPLYRRPGMLDTVWIGSTLLAISGDVARQEPEPLFYLSTSRPGLTGDGRAYWMGSAASGENYLPEWEALFIEATGGPVQPWIQSGFDTGEGIIGNLGAFAVSHTGESALCATRLEEGGELLVRGAWELGQANVQPVRFGGVPLRSGRDVVAQNIVPGETWDRFLHVGIADSGDPVRLPHWFVVARTRHASVPRHVVITSTGSLNRAAMHSGQQIDGRTLAGAPEHVAINSHGDLVSVWRIDGNREALFLNGLRLVETGDMVPYSAPETGTLTNFLGMNRVSITGRSPEGVVSVYFVANVAPGDVSSAQRTVALYRIDVAVSGGGACSTDWDQSGEVNSADVSAFTATWLADTSATPPTTFADFNNDGVTNSMDLSDFITRWLAEIAGGC